jgi:GxxExxY protein
MSNTSPNMLGGVVFSTLRTFFHRQRRQRALQPAAIERVVWIRSKTILNPDEVVQTKKNLGLVQSWVRYKGIKLDCGYRIDLFVDDELIVELKSVDKIMGIHRAQLLTYMKLSKAKVGLLINFNVEILKTGIKRFVL